MDDATQPSESEPAATEPATQPSVLLEETPPPAPDSVDTRLADTEVPRGGILEIRPRLGSLVDPVWKLLNKTVEPLGLKVLAWPTRLFSRPPAVAPASATSGAETSTSTVNGDSLARKATPTSADFISPPNSRQRTGLETRARLARRPDRLAVGHDQRLRRAGLHRQGTLLAAKPRRRSLHLPNGQDRCGELLQQQLLAERQQVLHEPGVLLLPRPRLPEQRTWHQRHGEAERRLVYLGRHPGRRGQENRSGVRHAF